MEDAIKLVADALSMEPTILTLDIGIGEVPQWTSLGHLEIVNAIEKEIGKQLTVHQILSINKIKDIENLLNLC